MRKWIAPLVLVTLVASLGLVACGDDDDVANGGDNASDQVDDGNTGHDDEADETVQVLVVRADDGLAFEPDEIHLRVGERVRLTVDNAEAANLHDFTVDHMNVADVHGGGGEHGDDDHGEMAALHIALEPGMQGDIEFTPMEAGTYEFYCSVPGHAQGGMKGVIVVEE